MKKDSFKKKIAKFLSPYVLNMFPPYQCSSAIYGYIYDWEMLYLNAFIVNLFTVQGNIANVHADKFYTNLIQFNQV